MVNMKSFCDIIRAQYTIYSTPTAQIWDPKTNQNLRLGRQITSDSIITTLATKIRTSPRSDTLREKNWFQITLPLLWKLINICCDQWELTLQKRRETKRRTLLVVASKLQQVCNRHHLRLYVDVWWRAEYRISVSQLRAMKDTFFPNAFSSLVRFFVVDVDQWNIYILIEVRRHVVCRQSRRLELPCSLYLSLLSLRTRYYF